MSYRKHQNLLILMFEIISCMQTHGKNVTIKGKLLSLFY